MKSSLFGKYCLCVCMFRVRWRYGERLWTLTLTRSGFVLWFCHLLPVLPWNGLYNLLASDSLVCNYEWGQMANEWGWEQQASGIWAAGDQATAWKWVFTAARLQIADSTSYRQSVTSVWARTSRAWSWNRRSLTGRFGHRKIQGQNRIDRVTVWWGVCQI